MRSFLVGLAGVFAALVMTAAAPLAFGQSAPMDLHAAPAKAAKAPKAKGTPLPMSDDEILARANAWLNNARTITADFVQVSASGHRTQGEMALDSPRQDAVPL